MGENFIASTKGSHCCGALIYLQEGASSRNVPSYCWLRSYKRTNSDSINPPWDRDFFLAPAENH